MRKQLIAMHKVGMTYKEIAEELGISISGVCNIINNRRKEVKASPREKITFKQKTKDYINFIEAFNRLWKGSGNLAAEFQKPINEIEKAVRQHQRNLDSLFDIKTDNDNEAN